MKTAASSPPDDTASLNHRIGSERRQPGGREWHKAPGHLENTQLSNVDSWLSDTAAITVLSDQDGVANAIAFAPVTKTHQGLFENLLWRVKRQWHRSFPGVLV
jgi:hypothetical protein